MVKINVLRICYWCLLSISVFMMATVFPKWTFKDFIMPIIIMLCAMGAGYVDRMIDEEKEKNKYGKKYYCSRYEKEVELYDNHCLGCSLFPFNVGECPSRINLDNK